MDDRERWDEKYRGRAGRANDGPDALYAELTAELTPPGRALDLAAGLGRHALDLARRGFDTEAWDVSPVGLARLEERANAAGLAIRTRAVDLLRDEDRRPEEPFDLVVCVLFLERDLFGELADFVRPGGHLFFSTVTEDHPGEKPPARFRLRRGELAGGIPGFETLRVVERDGRAALLGRRS